MPDNTNRFSLIVPAAADKSEDPKRIPEIFRIDSHGIMHCVKSITGLNLQEFSDIYFVILRKHAEAFDIDALLRIQFRRLGLNNARIVILDNPTSTQAETIERTVRKENIEGAIFIKDADCCFKAEIYPENGVAVYPLEKLPLVDPRNKSYVAVDDMQHITNIIEKRIIGNLFNAGGYCFEDVNDFLEAYDSHHNLGQIYLSHLIYAMLLGNHSFRPIRVSGYEDLNL